MDQPKTFLGLSKDVHKISWLFYPSMEVNKNFIEQLSSVTSDKTQKLAFLCKVGGRSYDAALTALGNGYENCYNIVGGFEGDLDESGKRGNINGWKAENLPWVQV
jgi:rhodanese-related sulfurtransferase